MMLVEKYANHQPLNRRKNEQTINLPGPGTPNARGTSSEVAGRPTNSGKPFSPSPHESDHRGVKDGAAPKRGVMAMTT
jgi:hypothetical protein